jgi:hypothetical protein
MTSQTVTLKAIFGADIRRVTCAASFATLKETVASLFPNVGANFTLKYADSEDELVTISSQAEFEQAVKDSVNTKKTLRIFIVAAAKPGVPELKIQTNVPETPRDYVHVNQNQSQQDQKPAAATVDSKTQTETKQEPTKPDCAELKRLALAFITDCKVLMVLPEALSGVIDTMLEMAAKKEVMTTRGLIEKLLSVEAIKAHPSVQRILPFLPASMPCVDCKLACLSQHVPVFGPLVKWLLSKVPCLIQALPCIIEAVKNFLCNIPFPVLMGALCCIVKCIKRCCPCLFDCILNNFPMLKCIFPCLFGMAENEAPESQSESGCWGFPFPFALPFMMGQGMGQGMGPFAEMGPLAGLFSQFLGGPGLGFGHHFGGRRGFGRRGFFGRRGCGFGSETEQDNGCCGEKKEERTVHHGIVCDGCQTTPIVGTRYKCTICPDFDLCESCEAKGAHQAEHPLVKLKQARHRRGMGFRRFMRRAGCPAGFGRFGSNCPTEQGPSGFCPMFGNQNQENQCGQNRCQQTTTTQTQTPQSECKSTQAQPHTVEKETSTVNVSDSKTQETHRPASIPAVPKPEALAPTVTSLADKYAIQLNALESMGFTNRDLCIYMLERYNGNVQQVANWLLEKMKQ